VGWDGCPDPSANVCSFDVSKDVVVDNWFTTTPPLIAEFATECDDAPPDTFTSIQQVIFNGKGCSSGGCHSGNNPPAGMNLSSGNSFANTVGRPAVSSSLTRIEPGDANNSYLFRKVSAKTNPGSFTISGSPMPLSGSALSTSQLAGLAAWINAGAPQTGRSSESNEVEVLLGACG
jgi:PAB1-binding protein PBP1